MPKRLNFFILEERFSSVSSITTSKSCFFNSLYIFTAFSKLELSFLLIIGEIHGEISKSKGALFRIFEEQHKIKVILINELLGKNKAITENTDNSLQSEEIIRQQNEKIQELKEKNQELEQIIQQYNQE